ncbi:copper resistance CopC family protein, partial [Georgenia sp.]
VVVLVGMLALAAPAHAHDGLVSATPADGGTLTAVPTEVVLTFCNELLEVEPAVVVRDEAGEQLDDVPVVVDGVTVTCPLPVALPAGRYDVAWRVVSADGHPIEGAFTFTVAAGGSEAGGEDAGAPTVPDPTAGAPEGATDAPAATASGAADDEVAAPGESAAAAGPGALIWGIGLLAVALVVLIGVVLRARRK